MKSTTYSTAIGGTQVTARFTDLAENANGSVLVEAGDTVVLVTAVMAKKEATTSYFPLSVEYEEKFYAVGSILGSRFQRREGRPSRKATLNARLVDRTVRPLFPKGLKREVQIVVSVLSLGNHAPEALAVLGASLALGVSDIPWNGPVSGVLFSEKNGTWVPDLPFNEKKSATNHLLLCGNEKKVVMVEMEGKEVQESVMLRTCSEAQRLLGKLQQFQNDIISKQGKGKVAFNPQTISDECRGIFEEEFRNRLHDAIFEKNEDVHAVRDAWNMRLHEKGLDEESSVTADFFNAMVKKIVCDEAVQNNRRPDGRTADEVRTIYAQAGKVSPKLHGSGIFYRGGTHVFTALTLGSPAERLLLNEIENPDTEERFMHHYNFPPFAGGETGRIGSPKRREIGHGALAEKSLRNMLPPEKDFPYTIRLVSECFSSNGSTSMGSVCASTLALLDGGVPITEPVAGIAMGLMENEGGSVILTDIQGFEDHHGVMDFKVAGTQNGITAMQLDIKTNGIDFSLLPEILEKAKIARMRILTAIHEEIATHRSTLSPNAPFLQTVHIRPDTIGLLIGTGGKTIRSIKETYGVDTIDVDDSGAVVVSGAQEPVMRAVAHIQELTKSTEVGDMLEVAVKTITSFGAFAAVSDNQDGLIHISEFAPQRIDSVEDLVAVGDVVPVVVKEVENGKVALSVKDRDPEFFASKLHQKKRARRGRR